MIVKMRLVMTGEQCVARMEFGLSGSLRGVKMMNNVKHIMSVKTGQGVRS